MSKSEKRKILRRLDKARVGLFPTRTCPASRHVHMIVEALLDSDSSLARDLTGYEPEHMAGSIASVLEGLWKARRWMRWEESGKGGEWVPDLELIVKQTIARIEARSGETAKQARSEGRKPDQLQKQEGPT